MILKKTGMKSYKTNKIHIYKAVSVNIFEFEDAFFRNESSLTAAKLYIV